MDKRYHRKRVLVFREFCDRIDDPHVLGKFVFHQSLPDDGELEGCDGTPPKPSSQLVDG